MDVYALRVSVVAEEWLQVFPVVEAADLSEGEWDDAGNGLGLPVAPDGALNTCGLDLAAVEDNRTDLVDEGLVLYIASGNTREFEFMVPGKCIDCHLRVHYSQEQ